MTTVRDKIRQLTSTVPKWVGASEWMAEPLLAHRQLKGTGTGHTHTGYQFITEHSYSQVSWPTLEGPKSMRNDFTNLRMYHKVHDDRYAVPLWGGSFQVWHDDVRGRWNIVHPFAMAAPTKCPVTKLAYMDVKNKRAVWCMGRRALCVTNHTIAPCVGKEGWEQDAWHALGILGSENVGQTFTHLITQPKDTDVGLWTEAWLSRMRAAIDILKREDDMQDIIVDKKNREDALHRAQLSIMEIALREGVDK